MGEPIYRLSLSQTPFIVPRSPEATSKPALAQPQLLTSISPPIDLNQCWKASASLLFVSPGIRLLAEQYAKSKADPMALSL
jgi:hypothetical protein